MTTLAWTTVAWMLQEVGLRGSAQTGDQRMTTAGWIFMLAAWLLVTGLALNCFRRVLGGGPRA